MKKNKKEAEAEDKLEEWSEEDTGNTGINILKSRGWGRRKGERKVKRRGYIPGKKPIWRKNKSDHIL